MTKNADKLIIKKEDYILSLLDESQIPSKTSDLTNDSGFITSHQDITGKEDSSNKVTSWGSTLSDTKYPSEKLVKESIDDAKMKIKVVDSNFEISENGLYFENPFTKMYYTTKGGYGYSGVFTSDGDVVIDWGDGATTTVNSPQNSISHQYTDGVSNHTITYNGIITSFPSNHYYFRETTITSFVFSNSITSIPSGFFYENSYLFSVTIPDTVTSIGGSAFYYCSALTSIDIPKAVTSIGGACFKNCARLVDYQLHWDTTETIITYDSNKMPNNTNTIFTIPYGITQLYIDKGYPSNKLVERSE